nr:hypothetical protein CFP56_06541 [Quercus suber]
MTINLGPIDRSVLTEQVKHRSELLWNPGGQDPPGTLDCRSRHEELTLQGPIVDDRVLAIMVTQPKGVNGPPLPPIPLAMKWAGAICTKNAPTHVLSAYHNQIAMTWPDQVKWEPYGNDLSYLPPSFRIEGSSVWSAKMEILLATQLVVFNWFSEESYEYKFIKNKFMIQKSD